MKKFFLVLSVLAVLFFSVLPSQALVGMPDAVPGTDVLQSFFVVEVGGGLDTLLILQEVGGLGGPLSAPTGGFHWTIWDRRSNHVVNDDIPYSHYDVVPVSVRDLLLKAGDELENLEITLNGTLYYIGYITWQNNNIDNIIAKQYVVDTANGKASGVNMPAKEATPSFGLAYVDNHNTYRPRGYLSQQTDGAGLEAFSPQALAIGNYRLKNDYASPNAIGNGTDGIGAGVPGPFRLLPRFYLHDANASNYIFIWKSFNTMSTADDWCYDFDSYDTEEHAISTTICIPDELNILDVRKELPASQKATYPAAGWWNLVISDGGFTDWATAEYDAYNWQFTSNGIDNWSVLFQVHRDVGTLPGEGLDPDRQIP